MYTQNTLIDTPHCMYNTCSHKHSTACTCVSSKHVTNGSHTLRVLSLVKHRQDNNVCFCQVGERCTLTLQQLSKKKAIWMTQKTGLCVCVCVGVGVCGWGVAMWQSEKTDRIKDRSTERAKCHVLSCSVDLIVINFPHLSKFRESFIHNDHP